MGLQKKLEKANEIIFVLHEMFENHDKIIHSLMEINHSFERQIKNQDKRIDLIMDEIKRILKKEEENEKNKLGGESGNCREKSGV